MESGSKSKEDLAREFQALRVDYEELKSELKFKSLIEGISDVIYEIDKHGVIRYISPSIEKLCGFSQDEIIGQHFQSFVGTNAEYIGQRIKILAQEGEIENDYQIKSKNGELHWIRFSSRAIVKDGLFQGGTGTLVDITEKKRIELELQESEALYRSILHASPDVITITDLSGRIRFSSPKAATMFGLESEEETKDHLLFDYILPDDHERATLNISKMLQGEFGGAEVYTGRRKDGSCFDIEVNGEFIRDIQGEPTGWIFVTRDISERRKTEEKLRKNEENFRFLVETINDAIYEIDKSGIVNYVSPAIEKILGYKPEELIGTNFFTYMYPEDVPILMKALSTLGEVDSSHLEYRYITRDGQVKWVSSSTSPIKIDGVVVGGTGSLTDINGRKLAENEIRKLSRAVEQSPVSIVITNLEGNIEYANPKVLETTGYSLGELIGKNPRVLKSGETAPDEYDFLWNSITSGNNWHGISHNRRKDGTYYWESSTISPILDQQGNITHYLAVKEDITERKKNEEALKNSEERFSQLAEQSQTVIWEVDAEGLYTFASDMSLLVWGYSPDELVGKMHFYDLHPAGSRSTYKEQVLSLFSQKVSFKSITNQVLTKNGKLIWVLTNGIPILDGDEKLVGYRGADNEITDKIQKDNELKKLSLAVEQSPVSIVITDLHANIEYVNPAFELTTLYKLEEVTGKSTSVLKSGETPDEVYKDMWETITAGLQWQGEWLNRKKSGELFF
jgi:PAS domain S-box-containing protein